MTSESTVDTIPIIDISAWTNSTGSNCAKQIGSTTPGDSTAEILCNQISETTCHTQDQDQQQRYNVVESIEKACREIGFFVVTGHGINDRIIEEAFTASRDFFDLPLEKKLESKTDNEKEYPYGYEHSERLERGRKKQQTTATCTSSINRKESNCIEGMDTESDPVDLKETFSIGPDNPDSGMPPRRFPENPPQLQLALELYYTEMEYLSSILFRIIAMALNMSSENWFFDKFDHHCSALRILNYFPVDTSKVRSGSIRASAHTDYGAFTILKSGGPGLQVKKDSVDSSDEQNWIDVPVLDDAFIVNLGDLMPRWTNDRWVSTLHRVIIPTHHSGSQIVERRQSIAFFCNVNGDTIVETIETCIDETNPSKYRPITAMEHLMSKHLASMSVD